MFLEVAEHLVRFAVDAVTLHAFSLAEEQQRPAFLGPGHRVHVAAAEPVERCVGEDERELELGNRLAVHVEVNRLVQRWSGLRKELAKQAAVDIRSVQRSEHRLSNRLVAEAARIGQRQRLARAVLIVELAEAASQPRVGNAVGAASLESRELGQFRRRQMRLRLQKMRDAVKMVLGG